MKYYKDFKYMIPEIVGEKKKIDNTIYTFDIETTSFFKLDNKIFPAVKYINFSKKEQENCEFFSNMYIWQLGINNDIYYGRTWEELKEFFTILEIYSKEKKIIYVHNLSFEFQFLKSEFIFSKVFARKKRKVMYAELSDFNIEFRCSYYMSNCSLKKLSSVYMLDVEKLEGDLDYSLLRNSKTELTEKELKYCENDCLVVYEYIKKQKEKFKRVDKIPKTSTGFVRKELQNKVLKDYKYYYPTKKSINTNPHIYNLLNDCFTGGYTHANWIYTDEIVENVDSWDFTSSYPYVLVSEKYPMTTFKKIRIEKIEELEEDFAYLIKIKFYNIKSKFFNNFISKNKCIQIKNGKYDNGRVISADELEIVFTDIDFKFINKAYKFEKYEILESYCSIYKYLPIQYIDFILEKYIIKTEYKGIKEKEMIYNIEKQKFNSIYGMTVTNNIRDTVVFDNVKDWYEVPLTNEEIQNLLYKEYNKGFLSFSWGVWVTSYARRNLLENVLKLDEYVIYCDTDSIKVRNGYDEKVIEKYNEEVYRKLKKVSKEREIEFSKFSPTDIFGIKHPLGVFDNDGHYERFITQGAKKYAVEKKIKNEKIKDDMNVIEKGKTESKILEITVAGVPKQRL